MNFQEFKNLVIAACENAGITEYELYYEAGSSINVDTFQHSINEFSSSTVGGVCFRCIVGGKMGYASTEALNAEQAKAIVAKAADSASVLEAEEQVFLGEGGQEYEQLQVDAYELPSTEALIGKVLDAQEKLYAADPMVIDGCQANGFIGSNEIAIYNSKGLDLQYRNNSSGLLMVGVVSDGKEMANNYEFKLGKLDTIDSEALAKRLWTVPSRSWAASLLPRVSIPWYSIPMPCAPCCRFIPPFSPPKLPRRACPGWEMRRVR